MDTRVSQRRLTRNRRDHVLFGVCGGIGEHLVIDPALVRLAFVLVTLAGGAGVLIYLVLAVVLPEGERDEPDGPVHQARGPATVGLVLIGLGLFLLVNTFSWFSMVDWGIVWPLLLIGLGVAVLVGRGRAT